MKRFVKAPTLFVVLALMLLATPAAALQQDEPNYDDITEEVSSARGLEVLQPIVLTPLTREQLRETFLADLEEDWPEEERYADQRELVAFGLLAEDVDLGDLYVDLYSEQVAGYYSPEDGEMVVIRDADAADELSASEHVTYAHEVVHALQDQHFDLDAGAFDREEVSDDRSLAVSGLIEGDATFFEIAYLIERPELLDAYLVEVESMELDTTILDSVPPLISATLYFPYQEGYLFVEALYAEGGYDRVDQAFSDPPISTEQILHPEKYLAGEQPVTIDVPDFTETLGSDWTLFDDNTFGEYQIRVILQGASMPDDQAVEAAAGWGGDTYIVGGTDDTDAIHWVSVWETEDDAAQFARAWATWETDRWGVSPTYSGQVLTFEADGAVTQITLDGDTVTYVKAPDAATLETIAAMEPSQQAAAPASPVASPQASPAATPASQVVATPAASPVASPVATPIGTPSD